MIISCYQLLIICSKKNCNDYFNLTLIFIISLFNKLKDFIYCYTKINYFIDYLIKLFSQIWTETLEIIIHITDKMQSNNDYNENKILLILLCLKFSFLTFGVFFSQTLLRDHENANIIITVLIYITQRFPVILRHLSNINYT